MRRTLATIVAGLILVGLVVAMLPAQDTSPWRRSSRTTGGRPSRVYVDDQVQLVAGEYAGDAVTPSEPGQFPKEAAQNLHAASPEEAKPTEGVRQAQLRRRAGIQDRSIAVEEST